MRNWPIVLLIPAFTVAQLLVLCLFGYTPYPDSDGYLLLAGEAVEQGSWYPTADSLSRLPFLWNLGPINAAAASLRVFRSITPLLVVYSLLKGLTAWLVFALCRKLFDARTALIALVLYVVYPANYGESTSLLSELPFTFLALTACWLSIGKEKNLAAGLLLAVAGWFRPLAIVFLLMLVVAKRKKFVSALAGYLLAVGLIGGAAYARTGRFLYQAETGWMALCDYYHVSESAKIREIHIDITEKNATWKRMFLAWLRNHKAEYLASMPQKLAATYVSDNANLCVFLGEKKSVEYMYEPLSLRSMAKSFPRWRPVQWLAAVNLVYYYALLLLAIAALFIKKRRKTLLLCALVPLLGTLMLLLVGHGEARFHQPFMPFFIMMAAATISSLRASDV